MKNLKDNDTSTKTQRGDFGVKTFTTFLLSKLKNRKDYIEVIHLNTGQKILVEYDELQPEIINHKQAVKQLIKKLELDISTVSGFPILSKSIDFIFYAKPSKESVKSYSFKLKK